MLKTFTGIYEALLKEVSVRSIGVFPGKFKPPHIGHYKTCNVACTENDVVIVLISDKEHEGYSAETSLYIWNIYKKYLTNIIPFVCLPTPVLGCYDVTSILNTGEISSSIRSNVPDLVNNSREIQSYMNVGNSIKINLYSSPEDQKRFERIKKEPYMGKNVLGINFRPVDRTTSATKFREALNSNSNPEKFLPEIDQEDKINILRKLNVKF